MLKKINRLLQDSADEEDLLFLLRLRYIEAKNAYIGSEELPLVTAAPLSWLLLNQHLLQWCTTIELQLQRRPRAMAAGVLRVVLAPLEGTCERTSMGISSELPSDP
jgi:hypothetical protein